MDSTQRAIKRALEAVERGEVVKKIGRRNSKLHGPKGIGYTSLFACQLAKLIEDGGEIRGAIIRTRTQVLTDEGRKFLDEHRPVEKLTDAMWCALVSARNHGDPTRHLNGAAERGGWEGTRIALIRRGMIDRFCKITDKGRSALEKAGL
jgi:hypothetical protein